MLEIKNFTFKLLVIKVNGKLIKKDQYENTEINEGDHVSVIHLISGG
ncbi:sulfur carrier protein ThiS [candidate division KSB1 bacterium]